MGCNASMDVTQGATSSIKSEKELAVKYFSVGKRCICIYVYECLYIHIHMYVYIYMYT
jgi:hypothetical protein